MASVRNGARLLTAQNVMLAPGSREPRATRARARSRTYSAESASTRANKAQTRNSAENRLQFRARGD